MKISTKGRYAIRAMLDIAIQSSSQPTVIKDISKRQGISEQYLEQLCSRLKAAGLVRSIRGPKGGFMLTKPSPEIKLIDIVLAMEGSTAAADCVENASLCSRSQTCATRKLWLSVKEAIDNVLESTTLQDLLEWSDGDNQTGACEV